MIDLPGTWSPFDEAESGCDDSRFADSAAHSLERAAPPRRHHFDVAVEQDAEGEWNAVALLAPEHGSIHVSLAVQGAGQGTIAAEAVAAACRFALEKAGRV